jgi:hypothetical protein
MNLQDYINKAHQTAIDKGWWEEDCACNKQIPFCEMCSGTGKIPLERNIGEQMLLQVSEICEAFEEVRNHRGMNEIYYSGKRRVVEAETGALYAVAITSVEPYPGCDKPEGVPIELADALIRIFDHAGKYGIDLVAALDIKMAYNDTRPYRHGGKKA